LFLSGGDPYITKRQDGAAALTGTTIEVHLVSLSRPHSRLLASCGHAIMITILKQVWSGHMKGKCRINIFDDWQILVLFNPY